jgi:hypothetical protein
MLRVTWWTIVTLALAAHSRDLEVTDYQPRCRSLRWTSSSLPKGSLHFGRPRWAAPKWAVAAPRRACLAGGLGTTP